MSRKTDPAAEKSSDVVCKVHEGDGYEPALSSFRMLKFQRLGHRRATRFLHARLHSGVLMRSLKAAFEHIAHRLTPVDAPGEQRPAVPLAYRPWPRLSRMPNSSLRGPLRRST